MRGAFLPRLVLIVVSRSLPDCEGGERGIETAAERGMSPMDGEARARGRITRICIGGMVCMFLPAVRGWLANKPRSVI